MAEAIIVWSTTPACMLPLALWKQQKIYGWKCLNTMKCDLLGLYLYFCKILCQHPICTGMFRWNNSGKQTKPNLFTKAVHYVESSIHRNVLLLSLWRLLDAYRYQRGRSLLHVKVFILVIRTNHLKHWYSKFQCNFEEQNEILYILVTSLLWLTFWVNPGVSFPTQS